MDATHASYLIIALFVGLIANAFSIYIGCLAIAEAVRRVGAPRPAPPPASTQS